MDCNSGIYKITNTINGNFYIGLSTNLKRRKSEHFSSARSIKKLNTIYKAIRKYSKENFAFDVIEYVEDLGKLSEREVYWIAKLNPKYNMNLGGLGNKGYSVSIQTKEVLRQKAKEQWALLTDKEKQLRISSNLKGPEKGHKVSVATREKLRESNLGKKASEKTKSKISLALKGKPRDNSNKQKIILGISETMGIISFNSCVSAGEYFNRHPSAITKNLKGKIKQAFGYKWEYLN